MEMPEQNNPLADLVNVVTESFYKVVPTELRTYCSVTSRISKSVLQHFGIETALIPCQMWLTTPEQNYVVGFTGAPPAAGKWNGHVICGTNDLIIDAALHNFTRDFDLTVPRIAACRRFAVPSQVICRLNLNPQNALWWYHPPGTGDVDLNIPAEPPELIARHAAQLIEYITDTQAMVVKAVSPDSSRTNSKHLLHKMI